MRAIFKISSRTLCIGRHTCHRGVYLLWPVLFCTPVRCWIYFCRYACTRFRIFYVPVRFIFRLFRFWTISDSVILWCTYEARIWFLTVTSSLIILRVPWIEGWPEFIMSIILYLFLKSLFSCVWYSTITALWLRKICSFCSSYWIFQILVINL